MMTEKALNVLRQMQDGSIVDFDADDDGLQDLLDALHNQGLVRHFIDGSAMLEPNGKTALDEAEEALSAEQQRAEDEMRYQRAENERKEIQRRKERAEDRRFNMRMSIINALICAGAGVLLTLFFEHIVLPLFG